MRTLALIVKALSILMLVSQQAAAVQVLRLGPYDPEIHPPSLMDLDYWLKLDYGHQIAALADTLYYHNNMPFEPKSQREIERQCVIKLQPGEWRKILLREVTPPLYGMTKKWWQGSAPRLYDFLLGLANEAVYCSVIDALRPVRMGDTSGSPEGANTDDLATNNSVAVMNGVETIKNISLLEWVVLSPKISAATLSLVLGELFATTKGQPSENKCMPNLEPEQWSEMFKMVIASKDLLASDPDRSLKQFSKEVMAEGFVGC